MSKEQDNFERVANWVHNHWPHWRLYPDGEGWVLRRAQSWPVNDPWAMTTAWKALDFTRNTIVHEVIEFMRENNG